MGVGGRYGTREGRGCVREELWDGGMGEGERGGERGVEAEGEGEGGRNVERGRRREKPFHIDKGI